MATLHRIPPPLASDIDPVGLATLLRGASTPANAAVSRTTLFLALKEMGSRPVGDPVDEMFSQLLSQTAADLLLPGNEAKLESILRYHAIASQVQARQATRAYRRAAI